MFSKQSQKQWKPFKLIGLFGLLILMGFLIFKKMKSPRTLIENTLAVGGYPIFMQRFWVCVSAVETAGWTSVIFNKFHNLFGMTWNSQLVYGVNSLAQNPSEVGLTSPEGQAFFSSNEESAKDLVYYMQKRFRYPNNFDSLAQGVHYLKTKNFFASDESKYLDNVTYWYKKIYG